MNSYLVDCQIEETVMKKLRQVQLAKQLGISKSYLSMILSGQRKAPESICSQLPVNFQAKLCLEGSRSIH